MRRIFGFRIEFLGDKANLYRLKPEKAPKDSFILLEYDSHTDAISLLDSPYMATWEKELQYYLGECHSYPAFFSSITLANLQSKQ